MFIAPEIIHGPAKLRRSGMAGPCVEFRIRRGRTCRSYGARRIVIGEACYKHGAPNGAFFLRYAVEDMVQVAHSLWALVPHLGLPSTTTSS